MKIIFFLFVTALLAFSSEKKIILGTYTHAQYASNALEKAKKLIEKDSALKIFMGLNNLSIQIEKIDAYNVISIKTFTNNKELFYVLAKFEKNYADVYVLPPYKGSVRHKKPQTTKKEIPLKVQQVQKTLKTEKMIEHKEKKPIVVAKHKPMQKVEKKVKIEKKVEKKEVEKKVTLQTPEPAYSELSTSEILKEDAALEKEINDSYDTTNLFNYQIAITIIIAIILLMILFNTLMKLRKSSKKKNNDMM